jgi:DNA-binding CsgD family transcriptional regulator
MRLTGRILSRGGRSGHTTFVVLLAGMVRLAESDYRKVLEVIGEAAAVDGPVPFPEPVLDALLRLVPCDVVAYHERLACIWTGEPRGEVTPKVREAQWHYRHEDPLQPAGGAQKYSDFFSQRDFHRLGLYRELAKPLGVEDMIRVWIDPGGDGGARLEFDRAGWDFRERDRAVLDLLLPHLRQFRRNAAARTRSIAVNGSGPLTPREHEILELVAEGKTNAEIARVLWISPGTVRKHLENVFDKLGVHTRTAAVAAVFHVSR